VKAHFSEYLNTVLGTPQKSLALGVVHSSKDWCGHNRFSQERIQELGKRQFQFSRFSATAVEAPDICE